MKIEELPESFNDLKEFLIAIVTYEKFDSNNFSYNIFIEDYQWSVVFSTTRRHALVIPKKFRMNNAFMKFNKKEVISKNDFMEEVKKLNIMIDGLENERANLVSFIFIEQSHFYQFYFLCKKYGLFN